MVQCVHQELNLLAKSQDVHVRVEPSVQMVHLLHVQRFCLASALMAPHVLMEQRLRVQPFYIYVHVKMDLTALTVPNYLVLFAKMTFNVQLRQVHVVVVMGQCVLMARKVHVLLCLQHVLAQMGRCVQMVLKPHVQFCVHVQMALIVHRLPKTLVMKNRHVYVLMVKVVHQEHLVHV